MSWRAYSFGVALGTLALWAVPLSALPPGAERIQEVRNAVAWLQDDLRALVLEHLDALAADHNEFEDQLELLEEAVQDLVDRGGIYRPEEVRVLLDQAQEILAALLFHLQQARDIVADVESGLSDLQTQLDALKDDKLLSVRGHKQATRALERARQILMGKLNPPLEDLQNLSDDTTNEECVTGPFSEPNPDADLQDCFDDARAKLDAEDYEAMLDSVTAARAKLEPMLARLVQIFFGTSLRFGPVAQLLAQLKTIDRQLVSALKRQLRRPRPTTAPPTPPQPPFGQRSTILLFDLHGRQLTQLECFVPSQQCLQPLSRLLAPGVYLVLLPQQRERHWLVVR